jgi:hypothetical protein
MAKSKKMRINFGDVPKEIKRGGGSRHIPEGDYLLKIVNHEVRKSDKADGGKYINWQFTVVGPQSKGATLYDMTSLKPQALFNLRNLIHAATGKNVAGKSLDFDPSVLHGKVVAATVADDEYKPEGKPSKMRSRPVDYRPKDELELDEDEDEEEEEEETEEEEEEEDEDLEDVEVEEL